MSKPFLSVIVTLLLVVCLSACDSTGQKSEQTQTGSSDSTNQSTDENNTSAISGKLCDILSADLIGSALGKEIVKTEQSSSDDTNICTYYTDYQNDYITAPNGNKLPGGPYVMLNYLNMSVENQKKGHETLGRTIEQNNDIGMEHFVVRQDDGAINSIYLVLDDDHYISLNRNSTKAASDNEMIRLAAGLAQVLTDGEHDLSSSSTSDDKQEESSTSYDWTKMSLGEIESASEILTVIQFWDLIGSGEIEDAVAMLDADSSTRQAWADNFATLQSLEIVRTSPVYLDEWTDTRQIFKVTMEVTASELGEQWGWTDGENARWITLEKTASGWKVHEIANNR